jgi:hypothetical protein
MNKSCQFGGNAEPFALLFHVGTDCYALPPGFEPQCSDTLIWKPPPQQSQ